MGRGISEVPAFVALGIWIVFQVISSLMSGPEAGIAFAAHIGGFIAGLVLIKVFAIGRSSAPAV